MRLHFVLVNRIPRQGESMSEKAELLQPKFAFGALREQLAMAEDLKHLRHV
jgi:hypothetical protein